MATKKPIEELTPDEVWESRSERHPCTKILYVASAIWAIERAIGALRAPLGYGDRGDLDASFRSPVGVVCVVYNVPELSVTGIVVRMESNDAFRDQVIEFARATEDRWLDR